MTLLKTAKSLKERRRTVLICGILVLLPGAIIAYSLLPPASPISRANYNQIRKGMTEEQVTRLLGLPSCRYLHPNLVGPDWVQVQWSSGNHAIIVRFHPDEGRALYKCWLVEHRFLEQMRHWLGNFSIPRSKCEGEYFE
jgi:hypothetical protein